MLKSPTSVHTHTSQPSDTALQNIIWHYQCDENNYTASRSNYLEISWFYCKAFQRKISNYPKKKPGSAASLSSFVHQVVGHTTSPTSITISICIFVLVDSGSQYTLLRKSMHRKLGSPVHQIWPSLLLLSAPPPSIQLFFSTCLSRFVTLTLHLTSL